MKTSDLEPDGDGDWPPEVCGGLAIIATAILLIYLIGWLT